MLHPDIYRRNSFQHVRLQIPVRAGGSFHGAALRQQNYWIRDMVLYLVARNKGNRLKSGLRLVWNFHDTFFYILGTRIYF